MELIDKYFRVLDKGFIALKDYMGSDQDIEQAARVSYQKGTRKVSDTRGLIRYCMRNKHTSIFEQAICKFHVKLPLFVIAQWHRHRTWSYNQMSGRYSILPHECLETLKNKWRLQNKNNKQGSRGFLDNWPECVTIEPVKIGMMKQPDYAVFDEEKDTLNYARNNNAGEYLSDKEHEIQTNSRRIYEERLRFGIAREQARKDLPVSQYSEMFATVDLHNLFHFLKLRCDSHAQWEIRQYANVMAGIVKELFPLSFEAWYDYIFQSSSLSRLDRVLIDYYTKLFERTNREELTIEYDVKEKAEEIGMSKRELNEFWDKFKKPKYENFSLDNFEVLSKKDIENYGLESKERY